MFLIPVCLACALSASAQFFSLGPTKTVPLLVPHPPDFGLSVRRVAFGNPQGTCANEAGELVDRMVLPDFQQNQMDVIERQALDQIMAEHKFSQSGNVDLGSASQLGKILGPSALIIVSVNSCSTQKLPLFSDRQLYSGVQRTFISKTRASLEGSVRVVDLSTGKILGSHNFESKPERSNSSTSGEPEFPPDDEVKDAAMQAVKLQIHAMFFPAADQVDLPFYDDKDCDLKEEYDLFSKGDKDGALRTADNNLEACKAAHKKDKSLARAFYDAAVLHCVLNQYDKAAELFTGAIDNKGADVVAQATAACQRARAGSEKLAAYESRQASIPTPQPIVAQADPPPSQPAGTKSTNSSEPAAPGQPTVEERLKKLDTLLKRGLITKKEYDEKRAKILKDL
jgi:curli biogenesis system outer membrane secretion channel CsgG